MAMELLGYMNINEQTAVQEAAAAGIKSMEHLIRSVSYQQQQQSQNQPIDCREITDFTVSKFKRVISILNRTGHARFRRAPAQSPALTSDQYHNQASGNTQPSDPASGFDKPQTLNLFSFSSAAAADRAPVAVQPLKLDFVKANVKDKSEVMDKEAAGVSTSGNSSSTFVSSITGEGSVSNGKGGSNSVFTAPSVPAFSAGKPPLSGKRCREHDLSDNFSGKTSGSSRCHCKKRKLKVKRTVRVPAISSKIADIPQDEYSWRKYGQKPIKGSPYPRGYYRCSSMRGCPARKHVERATDDPTMLIVTYEGEHRHIQSAAQGIPAAGTSATAAHLVVF